MWTLRQMPGEGTISWSAFCLHEVSSLMLMCSFLKTEMQNSNQNRHNRGDLRAIFNWVGGGAGGRAPRHTSDGEVRSPFLGLKLAIREFFGWEIFWWTYSGWKDSGRTFPGSQIYVTQLHKFHLQTLPSGLLDLFWDKNLAPFVPPSFSPPPRHSPPRISIAFRK